MSSINASPVDYAHPSLQHRQGISKRFWVIAAILGVGLFFTLLVPTMCRSSVVANRIKSSSNLRQIGLALQMYAAAHKGQLPKDFSDLALATDDLPSDVFVSASSNDERAVGKTVAAGQLTDPTKHACSYRYLADGASFDRMKPEDVLAIEPPDVNDGDGIHVLYRSGEVDWLVARDGTESGKQYRKLLDDFAAGVRPVHF